MTQYFKDIQEGIRTSVTGLKLTLRHFWQARESRKPINVQDDRYFDQQTGIVTLQYPFESLPIPDNGRYRLHNEIDDCIVCDKCAKVCPVDCISIDAIKATEEVGKASDGSPIRLYAGRFDIDMAKCCYCGLCTTVCPTECLTMTKTYDYSEFDLANMTYHYTNLSPEQADEKRRLYEQFVREKEELKAQQAAAKAAQASAPEATADAPAAPKRPAFRPGIKPKTEDGPSADAAPEAQAPAEAPAAPKRPAFRPGMKPTAPPAETPAAAEATPSGPAAEAASSEIPADATEAPKKPVFRPGMKPKPAEPKPENEAASQAPEAAAAPPTETPAAEAPAPKRPAFRPSMKPANSIEKEARKPLEEQNSAQSALEHPVSDATPDEAERIAMEGLPQAESQATAPQPPAPKRPPFRPTMKPKE